MEREEILKKASSKKAQVGEYENQKIAKSNWISVIVAGIVALAFICLFGALVMITNCILAIVGVI